MVSCVNNNLNKCKMTDKELLKECKNFIDNYAMWEERDYDGFDLANKIEKQLSVPRVSKSVNCDLCGNTGYLIAENGEVGEDCYKCDKQQFMFANVEYMKSADDRKLFYIHCQPSGCVKLRTKI